MPLFAAFASTRQPLMRTVAEIAIVCMCVSYWRGSAHAQDAGSNTGSRGQAERQAPAEALDHYNRGRAHYRAGHYQQAVVELERALALDPDSPDLVYNLARVYELLGKIDGSIAYYERYRKMLPAAELEERERITTTIQRLKGAKRQLALAAPAEPLSPPQTLRTERGVADGAFWTLASFSFAALAAGTVTGVLALHAEQDATDFVLGQDGDAAARERAAERADRLALSADAALATGAVGSLTSILLYALRTKPVLEPSLAITPHGLTLSLRGTL